MGETETLEGAAGMDDLHNEQLDHEVDKKAEKELLVPAGKYLTVPQLKVNVFENDEDKDDQGRARKVASLFGQAVEREKGNEENVSFKFSWHYREDERKPGKPDGLFKKYLQVKRLYKEANGEDAQTPAQLLDYVANYPVEVSYRHFVNEAGEEIAFVAGIRLPRDV